jgi:uncharacterized membrane protein
MDPKLEGLLCYLAWWITGIVFLVVEKQNMEVRFHAWQSIALFGGWTVLDIILSVLRAFLPSGIDVLVGLVTTLLGILVFILWILLMIQTYQGKKWVLPIVGPFAEQQVASGTLG